MSRTDTRISEVSPKIGLLVMGRKRPGFDPEWGAEIKSRLHRFFEAHRIPSVIPSDNIADDGELRSAVDACRRQGAEVLVVTQPTISDGRFAPMLAQLWGRPIVVWATPEKPSGSMISSNSLVGSHVFAATMRQLGFQFELLLGDPSESGFFDEFDRAVRVVYAASRLNGSKFGLIGYHAPGFIDMNVDPAALSTLLGIQLYHQSVAEFLSIVDALPQEAVEEDRAEVDALALPVRGVEPEALALQSRFYLALRKVMQEESLAGIGMRCWPDLPELTGQWPYLAVARLASEGRAVVPEGDVDGAIAVTIAENLGRGPVYVSDWLEHTSKQATIWHTGSPPFSLCDPIGAETGPTVAVHFNNRKPTVVEATIRAEMEGTLFRLWRCDGAYHIAAFEGATRKPARHLLGVNGVFESEHTDIDEWFDAMVHEGMPHHVCLAEGHFAGDLRRLARLIGAVWHSG